MKRAIELFLLTLVVAVAGALTLFIWHEKNECLEAGGVYVKTQLGMPVCILPVKGIV